MTEQRTFVVNGVTWVNSGTSTALTMMTEHEHLSGRVSHGLIVIHVQHLQ